MGVGRRPPRTVFVFCYVTVATCVSCGCVGVGLVLERGRVAMWRVTWCARVPRAAPGFLFLPLFLSAVSAAEDSGFNSGPISPVIVRGSVGTVQLDAFGDGVRVRH